MTIKSTLQALGWRDDSRQSIMDFQRGWNLGPALAVDGSAGPKTRAALDLSMNRRRAGRSDFSENFNAREFMCQCGGAAGCRRIWIMRQVVQLAEDYRKIVGPFSPARACRCPVYNARVAGAKNSQHLYGAALDLPVFNVRPSVGRTLGATGVGYYKTSRGECIRHLDLRHISGNNTTGARVGAPTTWHYGNYSSTPLTPNPQAARPAPAPAPAPTQPQPAPKQQEEYMARISPDDWRLMTCHPDYAFYKNRLAADPETAPRQPLGKTIEDATDTGLAAIAAVEQLSGTVAQVFATLDTLEAAVAVLSANAGLDPDAVQDVLHSEVRRALEGLEGKLTFDVRREGD